MSLLKNSESRVRFVLHSSISLFLFCLSFFQQGSIICIFLIAVIWLLSGRVVESIRTVFRNKILLPCIAFYSWHLISLSYSANTDYALFDLQLKVSLLLFPFFLSAFSFSHKEISNFKRWFIAGALMGSVLCLYHAFNQYQTTKNISSFFYVEYSYILHTSYFSIYLTLAVLFLLEDIFLLKPKTILHKTLAWTSVVFLLISITLVFARTSWAVCVLTVLSFFVISIFEKKITRTNGIIGLLVIVLLLMVQYPVANYFNRFKEIRTSLEGNVDNSAPSPIEIENPSVAREKESGLTTRMQLWNNAINVMKDNLFFGVGVGDIKDELLLEYKKENYKPGIEEKLNPHNQYLHTGVSLGFVGIILLLSMLIIPFVYAIRNRLWIYALFIMIMALNCMTESILERQAGILLFAFFNVFFATQSGKPLEE